MPTAFLEMENVKAVRKNYHCKKRDHACERISSSNGKEIKREKRDRFEERRSERTGGESIDAIN